MATYRGAFLLVNGKSTYVPSEISWKLQKMSFPDAGRDQNFTMHPRFGARKRSLGLSWKITDPEQTAQIIQDFDPEGTDSFSMTYWDPKTNSMQTRSFYSGDISVNILSWSTKWKRYENLTLNVTEI